MATPINTPLTGGEIWHLSIEDLLQPLQETPRLGGPGPFVINLSASSAPIGQPAKQLAEFTSAAHVYQITRTEDRRPRYRLRLGPFATEDEADLTLVKVRDLYPSALTATAETDDLRAIATLQAKAEAMATGRHAQRAAARPAPSAPVIPRMQPVAQAPVETPQSAQPAPPPKAAPPPAPAIQTPLATQAPSRSAAGPQAMPEAQSVSPAASPAQKHPAAAPTSSMQALAIPVLSDSVSMVRRPPLRATPRPAPVKIAKPIPTVTHKVIPTVTHKVVPTITDEVEIVPVARVVPVAVPAPAAPAPAVPPAALKPMAPVAAPAVVKQSTTTPPAISPAAKQVMPPPAASSAAIKRMTPPAALVAKPANLSVAAAKSTEVAATPVRAAPAAKPVAAAPAPVAAKPSAPVKGGAAPLAEAVVRPAAPSLKAGAVAATPMKPAPAAPVRRAASESLPSLESTQTLRPLTQLELEDDAISRWFVIQLSLSEEGFDPESLPNLDIFDEYRLYCVTGLDQGKLMHALRLGFFAEEGAAGAVASYLASFYDKPCIKRISTAERDRFNDQRVEARKDVGATGKHAVIEITSERVVREKRSIASVTPMPLRTVPVLQAVGLKSK